MAYGRDRLAVVLAQRRPFAVKDACRTMIARVPGRELVGNVKHEFCRITLCAERVAYEFQRGLVTDAADDEEQFFLRAVVDVQRGRTHAGACRNIACRGPVESQIAKCVQSCEQEVPRCTDCNGTPHVVGFNAWFSERFACHFGFLPNGHLASQISQTLSRHNSHLWPGSGLDHTAGSRPQMHHFERQNRWNYLQRAADACGNHAAQDRVSANCDIDAVRGCVCLLYTSPSPRDGLLSRMPS